jgi:hypothetical protein
LAGQTKQVVKEAQAFEFIKARPEHQFTLGLAYPANRPDKWKGMDGYRDFVGSDPLEMAAWNYMKAHRNITLFHEGGTEGHGTAVESYIYRGPDWVLSSPVNAEQVVIKAGDWLLGAIWDDSAWELVRKRAINGWSPEGSAHRERPTQRGLRELRR